MCLFLTFAHSLPGNINNSLMNLRACIERLRDNQKSGKAVSVPYRNDKMTHLFRNYFEGIGAVKMIVCINPRASDYDETLNVLQFSEMAQEIEIERFDPIKRELEMTPARHRANQAYQEAMARYDSSMNHGMGSLNSCFLLFLLQNCHRS